MLKAGFVDTVHHSLWDALTSEGVECVDLSKFPKEETISHLDEFDALVIRSRFRLTKEILQGLRRVRVIARAGAGMENIDVAFAESAGISCVHAPEGNRDAVAEHAIGMILALFNNITRADREVREGKWIREGNRGIELNGKTVGIIGFGNMGSAFARRLRGFDVKVLAYDKYKTGFGDAHVTECRLDDIFNHADIVSLHIPLTEETYHLAGHQFFNSFKKEIYIVNTARGKVLDLKALVRSIQDEKVRGACLDVLEIEDISFEGLSKNADPELTQAFAYLQRSDKVLLTPHIAGWTHESNEKIAMALFSKIMQKLK